MGLSNSKKKANPAETAKEAESSNSFRNLQRNFDSASQHNIIINAQQRSTQPPKNSPKVPPPIYTPTLPKTTIKKENSPNKIRKDNSNTFTKPLFNERHAACTSSSSDIKPDNNTELKFVHHRTYRMPDVRNDYSYRVHGVICFICKKEISNDNEHYSEHINGKRHDQSAEIQRDALFKISLTDCSLKLESKYSTLSLNKIIMFHPEYKMKVMMESKVAAGNFQKLAIPCHKNIFKNCEGRCMIAVVYETIHGALFVEEYLLTSTSNINPQIPSRMTATRLISSSAKENIRTDERPTLNNEITTKNLAASNNDINDKSNITTNACQKETFNYMTFRASAKQCNIYKDSSDEAEDQPSIEPCTTASNLRSNSLKSKNTERIQISNFPVTNKLTCLQTYQQSESSIISAGQCHICRRHLIDESAHCLAHINGKIFRNSALIQKFEISITMISPTADYVLTIKQLHDDAGVLSKMILFHPKYNMKLLKNTYTVLGKKTELVFKNNYFDDCDMCMIAMIFMSAVTGTEIVEEHVYKGHKRLVIDPVGNEATDPNLSQVFLNSSKIPTMEPMECQSRQTNFLVFSDRSNQAQNRNVFADSSSSESLKESTEECTLYKASNKNPEDDIIVLSNSLQQQSIEVNPKYQFTSELKMEDLKAFRPTDTFREYFETDFQPIHPMTLEHSLWLQRYGQIISFEATLNKASYFDYFTFLLHLEECEIQKRLDVFNQNDVKFSMKNDLFVMSVKEGIKDYTLLEEGTLVRCFSMANKNVWLFGRIENFHGTNIAIKFHGRQRNSMSCLNDTSKFGVVFYNGRSTFQQEHTALDLVRQNQVTELLFPTSDITRLSDTNAKSLKFFNQKIEHNLEQSTAIRNILLNSAFPLPYIIYGPPGTGKTTTMVEAILQIYQTQPNSNILVASATNSACDTVASYLLHYKEVVKDDILRVYGEMVLRDHEQLDNGILAVSNIQCGEHRFPSLNDLCKFRIIIATMSSCGRLLQGRMPEDFFTHVFIDECGSVRETTALIPMCISTSVNSVNANIILAGDPKQLGPVIFSQFGEDLGFARSYLERLMELKIYKKNDFTNKYDTTLITKLRKNYRSHPMLITLSNRLFYDNEIEACGDNQIIFALRERRCKILANWSFPMTFHATFGNTLKEVNSPSLFNMREIEKVEMYLDRIVNTIKTCPSVANILKDIGIIAPYRKQVSKLKNACEKYKDDLNIEVGSIEQFQGKEKSVIILSTVRSHTNNVGFLDNPKRFNVAMTRAKFIFIAIGNPKTLALDSCWGELVKYCEANRARIGPKNKTF